MMAYAGTPVVRHDVLLLSPWQRIEVGTPGWFTWLEEATSFSYQPTGSSYRLTVRKEKRGHNWYWYAYLKEASKLPNAYVGRSQVLSVDRLHTVTQRLIDKARQARLPAEAAGGEAMP